MKKTLVVFLTVVFLSLLTSTTLVLADEMEHTEFALSPPADLTDSTVSVTADHTHIMVYGYLNADKHTFVCSVSGCNYGGISDHARYTCDATHCDTCDFDCPANHQLTSEKEHIGKPDGSTDAHAYRCVSLYGQYCDYYDEDSVEACTPDGMRYHSEMAISGVHNEYQDCTVCYTGIVVGSIPHYPNGNCYEWCISQ